MSVTPKISRILIVKTSRINFLTYDTNNMIMIKYTLLFCTSNKIIDNELSIFNIQLITWTSQYVRNYVRKGTKSYKSIEQREGDDRTALDIGYHVVADIKGTGSPPPPTRMYKGAACVLPFSRERGYFLVFCLGKIPKKTRERGAYFFG